MYAAYFGLNENPFAITPNPRYLYLSARHAEALAHLVYGVTESGGFIQLTGEVGTGKTTLIRSLLEQLPDNVDVALILNPQMSLPEFLRAICRELGVEANDEPVAALNRHLLAVHARGRRVVLIIDEAQGLAVEVLEQIRLLTNLETERHKLMQIILVGQPELRAMLARADLRQLAQRITGRYHLMPLSAGETRAYVQHRLEVAGAGGAIFTPRAYRALYRASGGIPRLINILADRALVGAYSAERREVGARLTRRAANEVLDPRRRRPWGWIATAAVLALASAALAGFVVHGGRFAVAGPAETAGSTATGTVERPDRLMQWLAAPAAATDTDSAFATLFTLWKAKYQTASGIPACRQAEAAGLRCLYRHGSWNDLLDFDRPAIVTLASIDGSRYQAVVAGWHDGTVTLKAGADSRTVPLTALRRDWTNEFLLLWRPPPDSDGALQPGMSGPAVAWLDAQLARLTGRAAPPVSVPANYDAALAAAVRHFQQAHGLKVDGIAGERTLIELGTALGHADVPVLESAVGAGRVVADMP